MKKYLVSCATKEFYKKQRALNKSALKFGFDEVFSYTDKMIEETEFYRNNKSILDQKKAPGYGYSIWKPYIILDVMKKINEGDILFYVDSGAEIIDDIQPLVELCQKQGGILLFNAIHINKFWTKRDCFIKMGCDNKLCWESPLFMGGFRIYIKNQKSIQFLEEDLKYVQIPGLIDNSLSKTPNFPGFKRHSHDQSILTNLAIKYGIKGFRNPSQGGNHLKKPELRVWGELLNHPYSNMPDMDSDYPQIFFNKRGASKFRLFLIKLKNKLRWVI